MNTFEISCIEINRYDRDGNLIEEPAGYLFLGSTHNGEEGYVTSISSDSDRGYANVSITLNKDKILNVNDTAHHLCRDCLKNTIAMDQETELYGVGVINFTTKEIHVLDKRTIRFQFGDFLYCSLSGRA